MITVLKYVAVGTVAMLLPMTLVALLNKVKLWKSPLLALYSALMGTISVYLWFVLENHWFGGISFFGAVFLVPISFLLAAYIFKEKYGDLLDMFAPGICMMLAVMKVQCYTAGCCSGRNLIIQGNEFVFPSQLAELANALLLMVILLVMALFKRTRGKLYPWYMILYGCTRFVLNFFRKEFAEWSGVLPPNGTIWSVIAVVIGVIWLIVIHKRNKKMQNNKVNDG